MVSSTSIQRDGVLDGHHPATRIITATYLGKNDLGEAAEPGEKI